MKVVSLNINKGNLNGKPGIDLQLQFLSGQDAGLIFLQEVIECQVPLFTTKLRMEGYWGSMNNCLVSSGERRGNLVLSRKGLLDSKSTKYGVFDRKQEAGSSPLWAKHKNLSAVLVGGYCQILGCVVATTHFSWPESWQVTELQKRNLPKLLRVLGGWDVGLLGVDLNSARVLPNGQPGEIWAGLSTVLRDGVPANVITTLDPIHRFAIEPTVIDGLFFNPEVVRVTSLTTNTGLSDHRALVAFVEKVA